MAACPTAPASPSGGGASRSSSRCRCACRAGPAQRGRGDVVARLKRGRALEQSQPGGAPPAVDQERAELEVRRGGVRIASYRLAEVALREPGPAKPQRDAPGEDLGPRAERVQARRGVELVERELGIRRPDAGCLPRVAVREPWGAEA